MSYTSLADIGNAQLNLNSKSVASSGAKASDDPDNAFDQYLLLLTNSLKNQLPDDAANSPGEVTKQILELAGLKEYREMSQAMSDMIKSLNSQSVVNSMSLLGSTITTSGEDANLINGEANWYINAPRDATKSKVRIIDQATGQTVYSENFPLVSGENKFSWNGQTSEGKTLKSGKFKIVVEGKDQAGSMVTTSTEFEGKVDGIEMDGDRAILLVGEKKVPVDSVKRVFS